MREQPKNQISPDGLKVWRLQEIIISAVCLLIVIAVAVLSYYFHYRTGSAACSAQFGCWDRL
nr:hypothetical protein P5668_20475 [Bacillus subtilis]